LGAGAAAAVCVLDQAIKLWLLLAFRLAERGTVALAPFVDLVLVWNTGISYGWFQQDGPVGQWALLAFKAIAVALLWIWLARAASRLSALALGLIVGGAFGNAIDRLAYGAVADFVLLYAQSASWRFNWYVFNLADVAIVAGVAMLLYESLCGGRAAKVP
jgi:signal peptidase II